MTLTSTNLGPPKRGPDAASGDVTETDTRASVRVPMAESRGTAGAATTKVSDISRLSVGNDGRLYWDGTPVVVKRRLQLSRWQTCGALIVGLAALIIAASGGIQAAITAHDWMCSAKWITSYCPAPPAPPKPPAPPPPKPEVPN